MVEAENGNILLLSQTSISSCWWSFNCFTVERGVCGQPYVEFQSLIADDHFSLPAYDSFVASFSKKCCATISVFDILDF